MSVTPSKVVNVTAMTAPSSNAEGAQINQFWSIIYRSLAKILQVTGKDVDDFSNGVKDEFSKLTPSNKLRVENTYLHQALPTLMSLWHIVSEYNDGKGYPKAIPKEGPGVSFNSLMAMTEKKLRIPINSVERNVAIDQLLTAGCIGESPNGDIRALRQDFMSGGPNRNILSATTLRAVSTILDTISYNASLPEGQSGIFQRFAWSTCFPRRNLGQLIAAAESQGMGFLEEMDAFLMDDEEVPEEDQVYAGAGVYLFVDKKP